MKIGIFGGTGYIGCHITETLTLNGHENKILVRSGSEHKVPAHKSIHIVEGSLSDTDAVHRTTVNCDAVVYTVGIIREFPERGITFERLHYDYLVSAVDSAVNNGVGRFVLISANGVRPDGCSYQSSKYRAEEYLKASGIDWTIIRPSVVYGDPRGHKEFMSEILDSIIGMPFPAPLFYNGLFPSHAGEFAFSPIHVADLAALAAHTLENGHFRNRTVPAGGPDVIDWKTILRTVALAAGRKKTFIPAPVFIPQSIAAILGRFDWFPVTRDQLFMLMEGNICDSEDIFRETGIIPLKFSIKELSYLSRRLYTTQR